MKAACKKRALLVSINRLDGAFCVSLDDAVQSATLENWSLSDHVTQKEFSEKSVMNMSFSEKELADLGHYILARLSAFNEMGEI